MKRLFSIVLYLLLVSCVNFKSLNQDRLNSWLGANEEELLNAWGMPSSVYNLNGKKYVAFEETDMHAYQGTAHTSYCKITFALEHNKIVSWNYNNEMCFDLIKVR